MESTPEIGASLAALDRMNSPAERPARTARRADLVGLNSEALGCTAILSLPAVALSTPSATAAGSAWKVLIP